MAGITTHVLDTARGRPADGVAVTLERRRSDGGYERVGQGVTDADGRLRTLVPDGVAVDAGTYRIEFATADYFHRLDEQGFFPSVTICFEITAPVEHHHVPLLLSPFGYSTYRGS